MDILIFFTIICFLLLFVNDKKFSLKRYFIVVSLILLSSLRGITEGVDLEKYCQSYVNWIYLENIEPGYTVTFMFLRSFFSSQFSYIFFTSILVIILLVFFVNKVSEDIFTSLFLWIILCFYTESFNIIRQFIAMSFFACAVMFSERKKYIISIISATIAISFHIASIFGIFVYVLVKKIRISYFYSTLAIIVSVLVALSKILKVENLDFILRLFDYHAMFSNNIEISLKIERYSSITNFYNRSVLGFLIIQIPFSFYTIYCSYRMRFMNNIYIKLIVIGIVVNNLVYYLAVFDRFPLYLTIFAIIVFASFRKSRLTIDRIVFYCFAFYYTCLFLYRYIALGLSGVYPYEFL